MQDKGIALIGMSGSGKSTLASILARQTNGRLVDTDREIEKRYDGTPIADLLTRLGDTAYLDIEAYTTLMCVRKFLVRPSGPVFVATGGSHPYREEAVEALLRTCIVFYLRVPFCTIEEHATPDRQGTIVGLGSKSLEQLYWERNTLYEHAAHHIIEGDAKGSPLVRVAQIVSLLGWNDDPRRRLPSKSLRNAYA